MRPFCASARLHGPSEGLPRGKICAINKGIRIHRSGSAADKKQEEPDYEEDHRHPQRSRGHWPLRPGRRRRQRAYLGLDPTTGELAQGIEAQTRRALENVKAILAQAGLTMDSVIKTTVFLQHMSDFAAMNAVYAEFFTQGSYPARSAVEVGALPKGGLVEIECICVK